MLVSGLGTTGWANEPDADRPPTDTRRGADRVVTLITGDQVVLINGDINRTKVLPGRGRQVRFSTRRADGKLHVIPLDALPLIATGRLDQRLFDVTGLIEAGYDDRGSDSTPLIVSYAAATDRTSMRIPGVRTVRNLTSIDGAAVRVSKGTTFLERLPFAHGVERIWLDGKRRTSLDRSVPQIGAPTAWQAGYTGQGVTVAVLDGGIDATHPDLAGQVIEARNFAGGADGDHAGHGTHVASTIAGTAAASNGQYRGVAPDAKILDGKVCDDLGFCTESAILAGMQWAATEKRAKIINLSLSGLDTPELDPLEEAVNTLTAQTGSLFVIAAGNEGPGPETVGSPGSADAALTVGAVDGQDAIASFSSRGPRIGDGAIKPDITAPGVGIVAAKAANSTIGEPVGEQYLRLSGTSMATPHVVGTAALLAQQHPDWTAADLKTALMSSAKPHSEQGVFDQGVGRVDAARATTQAVSGRPGTLSFGTARWPHNDDEPVTRQLTYRNFGASDITLGLQATLTGPDGQPAPAGSLVIDATSVTVPAGGTAMVTVISSTRHNGPDGAYTGRITATGSGGESVVIPVIVDKEGERYDLTIRHLDPDGQPTGAGVSLLASFGPGTPLFRVVTDPDGIVTVRLPKGRYNLESFVRVPRGEREDVHHLVQPILRLEQDTALSVDARRTRPIQVTVPRTDARPAMVNIGVHLTDGVDRFVTELMGTSFDGLFTAPMGDPAEQMTAHVVSMWGVPGPDGTFYNTPYVYGQVNARQGSYFHGFSRAVRDSELATVVTQYNGHGTNRRASRILYAFIPGMFVSPWTSFDFDLPRRTTYYLEGGRAVWAGDLFEFTIDASGSPVPGTVLRRGGIGYRSGQVRVERWNAAVHGPVLARDGYAARYGNSIQVDIPMYSDQDGNAGFSRTDSQFTTLFRNGVPIAHDPFFDARVQADNVPGERADFRLVSSAGRSARAPLSTRTNAVWTFSSQTASDEGEMLPLWAVRYLPPVDATNSVTRKATSLLPIRLEAQPSAPVGDLTTVQIEISGNDGSSWTTAAVNKTGENCYLAEFPTPATGYVSLRAKVADSAGNTTEQSIIRAYALR